MQILCQYIYDYITKTAETLQLILYYIGIFIMNSYNFTII